MLLGGIARGTGMDAAGTCITQPCLPLLHQVDSKGSGDGVPGALRNFGPVLQFFGLRTTLGGS